jgi:hypothetical protein
LLNPLFPLDRDWHRGCYYKGQTKWRASGRFRMDLTARDPPKVPRCILCRFERANPQFAKAKREPSAKILSDSEAYRDSRRMGEFITICSPVSSVAPSGRSPSFPQ